MKKGGLFFLLPFLLFYCSNHPVKTEPKAYYYVEKVAPPAIEPEDFSPPIPAQLPKISTEEEKKISEKIRTEKNLYEYPVEINDLVKRFVYAYTTKYRAFMESSLRRSGKYISFIKSLLKEESEPVELAYLPIIESGFREKALSRARARGMWQFMKSTGRLYGLNINWWVDERLDPIRSTYAAVRYLKDLYQKFGDWNLALAAYNGGERRVERAIRRGKSRDFWKIKKYLRRQTLNYIPAFMATVIIASNKGDYGFTEADPSFEFDEVEVPSPTDLRVIAKCAGVSYSEIKAYNPHILRFITPGNLNSYKIWLPKGKKEIFLANFRKILPKERLKWTWYRVRRGDSFYSISRKFGVSVTSIKNANNLRSNFLRPGQRLLIPLSYSRGPRIYTKRRVIKPKKGDIIHRVKKGETFYSISRDYGVSIRAIKRKNNLWSNLLRPGQRLIIPLKNSEKLKKRKKEIIEPPNGATIHVVKKGETLYSISRKYRVSVSEIKKWNSLRHNLIKPGQRLLIYK